MLSFKGEYVSDAAISQGRSGTELGIREIIKHITVVPVLPNAVWDLLLCFWPPSFNTDGVQLMELVLCFAGAMHTLFLRLCVQHVILDLIFPRWLYA